MRHAVRSVFKQPLFSFIVIGTLALGIGLNVALFGIFNAMLFRPLPVQDPGRLVAILSSSTRADGPRGHLTYPDFEALRARRDVLTDAFALAPVQLGLSAAGNAVRTSGQIVTTNMFDVLGVHGFLGDEPRHAEPLCRNLPIRVASVCDPRVESKEVKRVH
jgi:putative ABC transport system permease protein